MPPPYDVGLVEGSISTPEEEERIHQVRKDCKYLITIGACATSGGIQTLRNWADVKEFTRYVYAQPEYIETLETATPVASHVFVDFELRGCPVQSDISCWKSLPRCWWVASRTFPRTASVSNANDMASCA